MSFLSSMFGSGVGVAGVAQTGGVSDGGTFTDYAKNNFGQSGMDQATNQQAPDTSVGASAYAPVVVQLGQQPRRIIQPQQNLINTITAPQGQGENSALIQAMNRQRGMY